MTEELIKERDELKDKVSKLEARLLVVDGCPWSPDVDKPFLTNSEMEDLWYEIEEWEESKDPIVKKLCLALWTLRNWHLKAQWENREREHQHMMDYYDVTRSLIQSIMRSPKKK